MGAPSVFLPVFLWSVFLRLVIQDRCSGIRGGGPDDQNQWRILTYVGALNAVVCILSAMSNPEFPGVLRGAGGPRVDTSSGGQPYYFPVNGVWYQFNHPGTYKVPTATPENPNPVPQFWIPVYAVPDKLDPETLKLNPQLLKDLPYLAQLPRPQSLPQYGPHYMPRFTPQFMPQYAPEPLHCPATQQGPHCASQPVPQPTAGQAEAQQKQAGVEVPSVSQDTRQHGEPNRFAKAADPCKGCKETVKSEGPDSKP